MPVSHAGAVADKTTRRLDTDRARFLAAGEDGVERLSRSVALALSEERDWVSRLSAGLRAGLDLLAADPDLAHLLLVELPAAAGDSSLYERSLDRFAGVLQPPSPPGGAEAADEMAHLLAAGVVSHLAGRVLVGESDRLGESHPLLFRYLLTPALTAARSDTGGRRPARP